MATLSARRVLLTVSRRSQASRTFASLVPIEDEFPGLPDLAPQPAKATSASVSQLSNGVTVVTEAACTTSTVLLTYPKAGTSSEMIDEQGAAFLNKYMNFKSGSGMSTMLINRTIEDEGGTPLSKIDRFGATVGYTVTPDKAVGLVPLLATNCSFEKWDVRDAKKAAEVETEVAGESAQIMLTENLFAAAYGPQSPAGRQLFFPGVSTDAIKAFRERGYGLNGAILSATGVPDHAAFCAEAESLLADAAPGSSDPVASFTYLGGESRVSAPNAGYAHVAMAFASPPSSAVTGVVKHLLSLQGMEAGVQAFSTKGLVGLYAGSDSPSGLVESICAALKSTVSPDMVKRAKSLAKAEALFAIDDGSMSLAEMMTAGVLESGSFTGPVDIAKSYDAVTDADVKGALDAMLKSNPSLAAVGNVSLVPYHATVASMLS